MGNGTLVKSFTKSLIKSLNKSFEKNTSASEEKMYVTIKGSLTESPSGVFSNFATNNYLSLQETFKLDSTTVAEFKIKINISSFPGTMGVLGVPNSYGINFIVRSGKVLGLYVGNGTSWNIINNLSGTTVLTTDTDYFVKLVFDRGQISVLLSTDDVNYTTEISRTATISQEYSYNLVYGRARSDSQYFSGSIDLNGSSITLGTTKYKIVAIPE